MAHPQHCTVRPAEKDDERVLFRWRNEPWIVRGGASQREVGAAEHQQWFRETLARQVRELFMVEVMGQSAGMVRFDFRAEGEAEISIYLLPSYWGKGHGRRALFISLATIRARRPLARLVAMILKDNRQSQDFFANIGFRWDESFTDSRLLRYEATCAAIRHSQPSISEDEISRVIAVLRSGQIAGGSQVAALEQEWSTRIGVTGAVAVASGLAALRLALYAIGVGPGDEVVIPAYSCVALLNAPLALGAKPVLADVTPDNLTLSSCDVKARITGRTKAIIAVDLFGAGAPIEELQFGLPVIEDCAHGIGGNVGGAAFGGRGLLSISSFYATKMLAAGEGGIVAGNDLRLLEVVRHAKDYGDQPPDGRHLNDKLSDIAAALARGQLRRLEETLAQRARRVQAYNKLLRSLQEVGLIELPVSSGGRIWYRYAVRLKKHRAIEIVARMHAKGVNAEQPVWDLRHTAFWDSSCVETSLAFDQILSLPLHPNLSVFDQHRVCAALEQSLNND